MDQNLASTMGPGWPWLFALAKTDSRVHCLRQKLSNSIPLLLAYTNEQQCHLFISFIISQLYLWSRFEAKVNVHTHSRRQNTLLFFQFFACFNDNALQINSVSKCF